ncbi:hypothetical protein ACVWXO_008197 [Bradyrhizobium sp. LM2.7]
MGRAIAYGRQFGRRLSRGTSFETPAIGGFLRMRSFFAVRSQPLMVRSLPKAGVSNHESESGLGR